MAKVSLFLRKYLGTYESKELARAESLLEKVRDQEKVLKRKSDSDLKALTETLRGRSASENLDDLLVEVFSLVSEAASRTIGLRPFDVQILGGVALHRGNVAEMKTGEGKTLTASLPVALNALSGKGVHVVTVNDYLAVRDAEWMGPIYQLLGLSVAAVTEDLDPETHRARRKAAYASDITYVTNHELVFDYLRDNLALSTSETVGRAPRFALVDEVDFLLLDEARTPLIISGPASGNTDIYKVANRIIKPLKEGVHYQVEHKVRRAAFLDEGYNELERVLGIKSLADVEHAELRHALHSALLAHAVYHRDEEYIVQEGQLVIVDEFTGRLSEGKRYADGLHQALEAKERLKVQSEDQTLAKITYQNYFRLYPKLSGMTGTAYSEREELTQIYGLGVIRIPTNKPSTRKDFRDLIFRTKKEKFLAVVEAVERELLSERPVLVGSVSVRDTEELSKLLEKRGIEHEVLNAKHHAKEAAIIAQAGRARAVTISTNMAGRGTDILLGGNPDPDTQKSKVVSAGGLAVIGTEWHESARIDDQLRGRAGRQGDPGSSQFFLSLEDPIYKKFGKTAVPSLVKHLLNHPKGKAIDDKGVRNGLTDLRDKVEVENRAIRKEVFRYDLVIEEQRQYIYQWRRQFLESDPQSQTRLISEWIEEAAEDFVEDAIADDVSGTIDPTLFIAKAKDWVGFDPLEREENEPERSSLTKDELVSLFKQSLKSKVSQIESQLGAKAYSELAVFLCLQTIDELWTEHLNALESLDEGIGLRGYAQRDPLVEFKKEAGAIFQRLPREIRLLAVYRLIRLKDLPTHPAEKFPKHSAITRKSAKR